MKRYISRLLCLLLALSLLPCLHAPTLAAPPASTPLSVTLDPPYLTIEKGKTGTLTATASDGATIRWGDISDPDVATVTTSDKTATVIANKPGTANITVTATNGTETKTATCVVTVPAVSVNSATISKADGTMPDDNVISLDLLPKPSGGASGSADDTVQLKAAYSPTSVDGTVTYTWTAYRTGSAGISDADSVVLQSDGESVTIKAVAAGSSVVQVTVHNTLPDGTIVSKSAQCVIEVRPLALNKLEIKHGNDLVASSDETLPTVALDAMDAGDSLILTPAFDPENATDTSVTWTSSDNNVVQVVGDGTKCTVLARGQGTATITAQAGDQTARCQVTVKPREIESIQITTPDPTLVVHGSQQLAFVINYSDGSSAPSGTVEWSIEPGSANCVELAPVTGGCIVTGTAVGEATVKVRVETTTETADTEQENGRFYLSDTAVVTVTDTPVGFVTLSPNSLTFVDVGGSLTFLASLIPANATGTVEWSSSDTTVATIAHPEGNDKAAVLTGVKPGPLTVTARVKSDAGSVTDETGGKWAVATCAVEVSGIELDQDALTLAVGESGQVGVRKAYGDAKSAVETDREWRLENAGDAAYVNVDPSNGLITAKAERGEVVVICSQGGYEAKLKVKVSNTSAAQVKHTIRSGEPLSFKDILSKLGSPEYLTGLSVSGGEGTLYYGYVSANNSGSGVSAADRFYRRSKSNDPSRKLLEQVTFMPAPGFTGDATVSYTSDTGKAGSLVITVLEPNKISYVSENGEAVYFRADDFAAYARARYGYSVSSVRFTIPDARYGWLYANYTGGEVYGSNITGDRRFYASSTPSIDTVAFVPKQGYTGTFTVKYDGVDTSGRSFTGDVEITVRSAGERGGDISYTAYVGDRLYFTPLDFQQLCTAAGKGTLDYVQFTALPDPAKQGSLYHGSSTTAVSKTGRYYYNSAGRAGNFLGSVNLLPAATGSLTIPFTAYASGGTVTGTVAISVLDGTGRASTVYYTSAGMPAGFIRGDFTEACKAALPGELSSVTFELPDASCGKLYERFQDLRVNTPLAPGKEVAAADLIGVTFIPKGGTEGSTYINYTAKDARGNTCSGAVRVYVEPSTASQYFKDMGRHGWAASSVDFLRRYGVVTGYGNATYRPASPISRGDFTLMLYRAFQFPDDGTASFPDVPSNSYYATAIAAARARGIAQGANGRFRPTASISRQDAAVLLYRALQSQGSAPLVQSYDLGRFTDGGQVAGYAQEAMSAMVDLGVFKGDNGRLKPTGTLTRAEMAVILHRAIT